MTKTKSGKKFFSNLQTSFHTSFAIIDTASKQIKLQRSAWSQIKAFWKCHPTAASRYICKRRIRSWTAEQKWLSRIVGPLNKSQYRPRCVVKGRQNRRNWLGVTDGRTHSRFGEESLLQNHDFSTSYISLNMNGRSMIFRLYVLLTLIKDCVEKKLEKMMPLQCY